MTPSPDPFWRIFNWRVRFSSNETSHICYKLVKYKPSKRENDSDASGPCRGPCSPFVKFIFMVFLLLLVQLFKRFKFKIQTGGGSAEICCQFLMAVLGVSSMYWSYLSRDKRQKRPKGYYTKKHRAECHSAINLYFDHFSTIWHHTGLYTDIH